MAYKRPDWDEYFMAIALVVSTRAVCKHVKAGCVIVYDKRIVGTGYNGTPPRIKNCAEVGCRKEMLGLDYKKSINMGKCDGVHAEVNALANLTQIFHKGATVYSTIFPCKHCVKNLLAYNVSRVVYKREYDKGDSRDSRRLLEEAGVEIQQLDLDAKRVVEILFNHPDVDFDVFSDKDKGQIRELIKRNSTGKKS